MPIFQPASTLFGEFCSSVVLPPLERIYKSHSQRQNTCPADKQPIDTANPLLLNYSGYDSLLPWQIPALDEVLQSLQLSLSIRTPPPKDSVMFKGHLKHSPQEAYMMIAQECWNAKSEIRNQVVQEQETGCWESTGDAQLSQCSWLPDKCGKISQFELVVSSRGTDDQINEGLPQVWQLIFPSVLP
ncbi:hypothetical protein P7K49_016987 [Saguinus oedipus]|uniref:Uncharacterized protein n=1 Tax=Saguinus oedipus TaxID=9490 RepID=A0ABQ9V1Y5_SAGOE|nr:hypothetical protein P7K49_016987 [Saguinus oedipus]